MKALADWLPGHVDHLGSALAHWMSQLRYGGRPVVLKLMTNQQPARSLTS